MEMDPQERDSDIGDDSPVSPNDEELSDPDGDMHEDVDSGDESMRNALAANNISIDHHPDVLAKLKMQVRDLKEREELEQLKAVVNSHTNGMNGGSVVGGGGGAVGLLGPGGGLNMSFPFPHPAAAFLPPLAPPPAPPSSGGSSHSSEGSASSQQTWSFEEQFKQVRQLYEINDDPKRKEFLDDLFSYMQKRGTPINRLPIMAKSVLDLYELYNLVIARGGLVDVINKKLWQEIIKGLHLPSSITSAAFTLRTQYMKYLYPYECEKRRLSTPAELQAAIDGNRREGRRSSYGYNEMVQRSPITSSQMSPLSLVSQQQSMLSRMGLSNGAHHPSHPPPLAQPPNAGGPIPGLVPAEYEARMVEYVRLLNKELRNTAMSPPLHGGAASPPTTTTSPINATEMSRLALWNLCNSNNNLEPQREALNLADPTTPLQPTPLTVKRESERREDPPPPAKRHLSDDDLNPLSTSRSRSSGLPAAALSTNIKITNRGDGRNGSDNSLVVSMEINGVTYQGVLFAQNQSTDNRNGQIST